MKPDYYYKEVLYEALKITVASVSVLISENNTDKENLVFYTNFNASLSLKAFHDYFFLNRTFTSKEMAIEKYRQIYYKTLNTTTEDSKKLPEYFKFLDAYKVLDDDSQMIIYAILSLSRFYKNNSINKIKNILHTYIARIRKMLKVADKYYKYFDYEVYTPLATKEILFNFLMECIS